MATTTTVKPRFEVHKLEGSSIRRVATPIVKKDDKGKIILNKDGNPILLGGFDFEDRKVDAGWMVYFPGGASLQIWAKEEMIRQGFLEDPTLVDMKDGELKPGEVSFGSLKTLSEQKARVARTSKVAHTG